MGGRGLKRIVSLAFSHLFDNHFNFCIKDNFFAAMFFLASEKMFFETEMTSKTSASFRLRRKISSGDVFRPTRRFLGQHDVFPADAVASFFDQKPMYFRH